MRLFIDGHNDTMMKIVDEKSLEPVVDLGRDTDFHIDLNKLERSALNCPIFASFSEGFYKGSLDIERSLTDILKKLNALYYTEEKNKDRFRVVGDVSEIVENFRSGRIGGIPSIEGAYFVNEENYKEILRQFKDLKVKLLGFTWNYSNHLGEGAARVYSDGTTRSAEGLSKLGEKALKEMEKIGMAIDVSHMSEECFWGVVENTTMPIVASHSGVYNLRNHRRNLKDDQLLAIKKSGGLVAVVLSDGFLAEAGSDLDDYMNHIDYIAEKIGIDHLAIGSDLDGTTLPQGIKDSSDMYKIVEKLEEKYTSEEVDKILSGNFLRVFKEVEDMSSYGPYKNDLDFEYSSGKLRVIGLDEDSDIKIVLDGKIIFQDKIGPGFDLDLNIDNGEKFHILSVEAKNSSGDYRISKIIKI